MAKRPDFPFAKCPTTAPLFSTATANLSNSFSGSNRALRTSPIVKELQDEIDYLLSIELDHFAKNIDAASLTDVDAGVAAIQRSPTDAEIVAELLVNEEEDGSDCTFSYTFLGTKYPQAGIPNLCYWVEIMGQRTHTHHHIRTHTRARTNKDAHRHTRAYTRTHAHPLMTNGQMIYFSSPRIYLTN